MVQLLLKLEMSLWINETRNNEAYLERIIHPTFYEIGQSKQKYSKADIIADVNKNLDASFPFEEISMKEINTGTYLISYVINYKLEGVPKSSYRTSIWLNKDDEYQLLFRQGTEL